MFFALSNENFIRIMEYMYIPEPAERAADLNIASFGELMQDLLILNARRACVRPRREPGR